MLPLSQIQSTIDASISFIDSCQKENGSFVSDQNSPTNFYTALILSILPQEKTEGIQEKGVAFLLSQASPLHHYNYWQKESSQYVEFPYPDDIDDTFVTMQALQHCDSSLITEKVLASLTTLLIAQEASPGGPYRTWITNLSNQSWQDIDIVANSNVASFLSLFGITLPQLQSYFDTALIEDTLGSKYYHNELSIIYFLSKAYKGSHVELIIKRIISFQNDEGHWGSPLYTAMAITSLLRFNANQGEIDKAISYLLETGADGAWVSDPLYIERIVNGVPIYSSCKAFVSACVVEALNLYIRIITLSVTEEPEYTGFIRSVHNASLSITADPFLREQLNSAIDSLVIKDPNGEIALLPYLFSNHLADKPVNGDTVHSLAVANTLGWIGYSIYDAILDGEEKVSLLPLANVCVKSMLSLFRSVATDSQYETIKRILEGIDSATAWEYEHSKIRDKSRLAVPEYGDYTILAKKSLGHALGPILLTQDSAQAKIIESFFVHYLIAKQLNDDAHDWQEDLRNGWFNGVSAGMVQKAHTIDPELLSEYFWETHIDQTVSVILSHTQRARMELKKVTILTDVTFLEALLIPLERSAQQAIAERDRTKRFLEELHTSTDC